MEQSATCTVCKSPIQIDWNFCPHCGKALQPKSLSTSLWKQVVIYSVSFFLPPFGLGYGFSYIKQKSGKAKIIGYIAIILTVVSLILVIVSVKVAADYYSKMLNDIGAGRYP